MAIKFNDSVFEEAVRKALAIPSGNLEQNDLQNIQGFLFSTQDKNGFGVVWQGDSTAFGMKFPDVLFNVDKSENGQWINDLQAYFKHIQTLHVYVPSLVLPQLEGFDLLQELYITNSKTTDWSFLANLTKLKNLMIVDADFSDLVPIQQLANKQKIIRKKLKETREKLKLLLNNELTNLALINCGIKDISPLASCRIDDLNLSHNQISDITPLSEMESLYYLTLRHNLIEDITPLGNLDRLYLLNLRHNQVKDITALNPMNNSNLRRFFVKYNNIKDYTSLKGFHFVVDDLPKKF